MVPTRHYLSLKDLAVGVVVRDVLPSFHSSTIHMRRKPEMFITRWTDLDSVAVGEWYREVNCNALVDPVNSLLLAHTLLIRMRSIELIHP